MDRAGTKNELKLILGSTGGGSAVQSEVTNSSHDNLLFQTSQWLTCAKRVILYEWLEFIRLSSNCTMV